MVQTTPNYGLQQPQGNDTVDLVDLITNNTNIVDTQMKANATAAAAAQTSANNAQTAASAAQSTANQALTAAQNISTATTTAPGTVEVSAPPASGQNPVAVSTTDTKYVNGAQLNVDQTWTSPQTWSANSIMAALGIATSANNYGSNQLQFQRSTWNGSAAVTDTSYLYKDSSGVLHYVNSSGTSIWQVDNSGDVGASSFAPSGLTGATSASRYVGATPSGPPTSGTFNVGDWCIDQTGARWTCTAAGTPGTWVKDPPSRRYLLMTST